MILTIFYIKIKTFLDFTCHPKIVLDVRVRKYFWKRNIDHVMNIFYNFHALILHWGHRIW